MNLREELHEVLRSVKVPIETGIFTGKAPDEYLVVTPLSDNFALHADNAPGTEVSEARISIFTVSNYMRLKRRITSALLKADFTITDRRYLGFDTETNYHGYSIDVQKNYELED